MKCPACAAEVSAESLFCAHCGHRLSASGPVAPKTPVDQFKAAQAATNSADDVETPLWKGWYSWKAMIGYWVLALLATIAGVAIGVVAGGYGYGPGVWLVVGVILAALWGGLILYYLYERISIEYELTNQRLIHRHGILSQVTNRIEVIDIDDIKFRQNLVDRFFGVGTIQILSTDVSDPKLTLRGIDEVKRVFAMMDDARRDERRRRGMYIETV